MPSSRRSGLPKTHLGHRVGDLLRLLALDDQNKFRRKLKVEDSEQATHTARELIFGAYLTRLGLLPRYEVVIQGKTPDWVAYTAKRDVSFIADVFSHHQTRELEAEMDRAIQDVAVFVGWLPDNSNRIYEKVAEKVDKYADIATDSSTSLVVGMFCDFKACVEEDEIIEAMLKLHGGGIYERFPQLAALVAFSENGGIYSFRCYHNPKLASPTGLRAGTL
jgi:hypothetical protein